jgi:O-antigen/teichoic acid export membrane protein
MMQDSTVVVDMLRLEAPAISISFPAPPFAIDNIGIADEPTWMLPAIPKPAQTGKQISAPANVTEQAARPTTQADVKGEAQTGADPQGYLSLALGMVKKSGIYAVGALASPLVSLILTPFLAHNLSITAYGGLAVLYTVIDLVTVMTQLGLSSAFFRAYNGDYESMRDRLDVLSTSIILLLLTSLPVAAVMTIIAPGLSVLLFNSPSFSGSVELAALVIVMENLTLPGISWLRAEQRAILYTALSIANMLVVLGTNIGLVGALHLGVNGALIAKGAGFAVMVAFTMPMMLRRLISQHSLHLRSKIAWGMLTFGIPTVFSDIAAWVLQLSDRYLLSHFESLAQTAGYSVAYVLGGVLSPVILTPWGLAWIPIMYSIAKREDAAHIFKLVFHWWSSVLLFAAFALSIVSTIVLIVLFPPAYRASESIIPIITLSTMFIGVWYIFMIGVNIRRKTILEFVYVVIAASMNVLLNIFLIPRLGAMGAAISTLIAYIVLVLVSYIVNQRIYPIGFEIGSFIFRLLVGVALYVGASLLAHTQQPLIGEFISLIALILYGVFLMRLEGLSVKKLISIFGYVQSAFRKG